MFVNQNIKSIKMRLSVIRRKTIKNHETFIRKVIFVFVFLRVRGRGVKKEIVKYINLL